MIEKISQISVKNETLNDNYKLVRFSSTPLSFDSVEPPIVLRDPISEAEIAGGFNVFYDRDNPALLYLTKSASIAKITRESGEVLGIIPKFGIIPMNPEGVPIVNSEDTENFCIKLFSEEESLPGFEKSETYNSNIRFGNLVVDGEVVKSKLCIVSVNLNSILIENYNTGDKFVFGEKDSMIFNCDFSV